MPTRFPISSGNWSNTAIWDNGALPIAGDFIHANGFTVAINQDINVGYISNGASAVYVPDISTPAMTGSNTPSGVASASNFTGSSFPWLAFDQNTTTGWATSNGVTTGWLKYQFPSAKIIRRYAILGSNTQTQNPRNWTLEGSNDDVTWTVVHTVTLGAAISASTWYNSGVFANSTAYLYYRINITLNGGGTIILVPEFQMTESTSTSVGGNPNGTFTMPTAYNITCTQTNGIINQGTTNTNPTLTISATTGSIAINSNIRGGTITSSNALTISGAGHNITITGDVFGGSGTATFGINRNASGTLNINGLIYSGLTTSTAYSINNTALGTGTITVIGGISTSGSAVAPGIINAAVCTINITGNIGGTLTNQNTSLLNNSGAATINITGTISIASTGFNAVYGLVNSGNSTITINGNVNGGTASGTNNNGVASSLGSVTITGNITGGGASSQFGAVSSGGTLTVNGTVTGGTNCSGISSSGTSVTINGDVYASATSPGAESSSNTTLFLLNGSAYGNGYLTAFAVRRLGIIPNPSMVYRMANNTGAAYNFYPVGSTALGTPATTDVRNGVVYASGALTGTLVVPPATAVTVGVTYDNGTLGTAQNTAASFLAALGSSTDPLAVRLQNVSTVQTTGAQIAAYNV